MKTYTLEELKLAQAKGCRIEYYDGLISHEWQIFTGPIDTSQLIRIHPADEWKARLPRLKEGAEWHRKDFTNEMLEGEFRPHLLGETGEGEYLSNGKWKQDGPSTSHLRTTKHCQHTRTRRPVPPEFLHTDELAKQLETAPQTDTPETDEIRQSYEQQRASVGDILEELGSMERRAIAAEARVKELEAANTDLIQRLQERVESYLASSKRDVQTIQQQAVELDRLRASLRLRPIAEAGPVPDGMIRLHAHRIPLGPPGAEFWSAFSEPGEEDTHCVDIYPPQQ